MNAFVAICSIVFITATANEAQAASCSCNCNDGVRSNFGNNHYAVPERSIKQCVFPSMNDDTDAGPLPATCTFEKSESHTSLRVTFNGNMRVTGCSTGCCRRWFFTINGEECKDPATIDTQVIATGTVNRHSPKTLDGFYNNVPKGPVKVGLSIAVCPDKTPGDAYTGWASVSRIVIEELPPLKS